MSKIIQGDCLEVMKDFPDESVDLVVTDPPYKIHSESGGGLHKSRDWLKDVTEEELNEFKPKPFLKIIEKKLKTFNAYIFTSKDLLTEYLDFIEDREYNWDLLHLSKKNPIPTKNNKYLPDTELILFIREEGACFNNKREFDLYRKNKVVTVTKNNLHPTKKPIKPIKEMIKISSGEEDLILDPYLGVGTTAKACKILNRNYIGIELKEKYAQKSREHLEETMGQKDGLKNFTNGGD